MRLLSIIIISLLSLTNIYGQIEIELYFKNSCDNSISKLDFELKNLNLVRDYLKPDIKAENGIAIVPGVGKYYLTSSLVWGDNMVGMFDQTIEITDSPKQIDTLYIPAIKFTWDGVLHSRYWNYFNCDKLCDGVETDLFPNGRKRFEGEFKEGKPIHLIEYRMDGTKETEFWYVQGTQLYKRVDYFDEFGKLDEYDIYKNEKHRTVKTTYTSKGKKAGREIIKHGIEK